MSFMSVDLSALITPIASNMTICLLGISPMDFTDYGYYIMRLYRELDTVIVVFVCMDFVGFVCECAERGVMMRWHIDKP